MNNPIDKDYGDIPDSNIFIIGGVGSGKTELTKALVQRLPFLPLDFGKLFRYATLSLIKDFEENSILPNFDLLKIGDENEVNRIMTLVYKKNKVVRKVCFNMNEIY